MMKYEQIAVGQQLPSIIKKITQAEINRFATVSGSDGRSHIDEDYATKLFGSTLAQGMMVVDAVSQIMAGFFSTGQWLQTGKLEIKFVGMVRPVDSVTSTVTVTRKEIQGDKKLIFCEFACENQKGEKAIVGTTACQVED